MAQIEALDSPYASWVSGLIAASVVLFLLTVVLSLGDGTVGKAFTFGVASFVFAVVARVVAQATAAHKGGATVGLVVGVVALLAGMQALLLGTGQI
jgi:tellurite resistance protein TehA-like permease